MKIVEDISADEASWDGVIALWKSQGLRWRGRGRTIELVDPLGKKKVTLTPRGTVALKEMRALIAAALPQVQAQ